MVSIPQSIAFTQCSSFRVADEASEPLPGSLDTDLSPLHLIFPGGCWLSPPETAVAQGLFRRGLLKHRFHGLTQAVELLPRVVCQDQSPDKGPQVVHAGAWL
jgi:hypothetical protein